MATRARFSPTSPRSNAERSNALTLITTEQTADLLNAPPADLVVLDVRTPDEFSEGHLAGAIQIDFYDDDFADQLAGLDRSVPYLVYCRSAGRSGKAVETMAAMGFGDLYDMDGGMLAWSAEGRPTVT